jgi:hypothetical protein
MAELKDLIGKTLTKVEKVSEDEIIFITNEGKRYKLYHSQDCCESVTDEDIEAAAGNVDSDMVKRTAQSVKDMLRGLDIARCRDALRTPNAALTGAEPKAERPR